MNLVVSNDLTHGLSQEALARGVTMDELADTLLRSIVQDRLFDAVIDDENRLPRRHRTDGRRGPRMTLVERRAKILQVMAETEGGEITVQRMGGYAHLWIKALRTLHEDGTIRAERRQGAAGWPRVYYSRTR